MLPGRRISVTAIGAVLLALVVAHPASARGGAQLAAVAPIQADRVVVFKGERKLVLMVGERVLRVYRVALGRYPTGGKTTLGDARTPEGSYVLDYRVEDSNFYRAIHVSYPNPRDTARAEALGVSPGGQIMIHGLPPDWSARQLNHPDLDWTQGCIAVTNREIDEILAAVHVGTPIDILP